MARDEYSSELGTVQLQTLGQDDPVPWYKVICGAVHRSMRQDAYVLYTTP